MTTLKAQLIPLSITPGVQPNTDKTPLATPHFTAASKIRFRHGFPQKIGGWVSVILNYSATILGLARSLFSTIISTSVNTVIGTSSYLYYLSGTTLTNITPLQTTTTAIANSLANDYATLANNPITTVINSNTITIADTNASNYQSGDLFTLSGATATGGIAANTINAQHTIHTVAANSYTTIVGGSAATSSATGGGNAVVRATGLITATATAHGMSNGYRVKIAGATAVGGITAAQINLEWIIRGITANTFNFFTAGTATSSVSGGGGAGTTFAQQIAAGNVNQGFGTGYGCGLYGNGLYGTALVSVANPQYPQIWFMDRFGANIIMTPGNQSGVYTWAGATATAPTLISNAPTTVNYAFVSDNILVTFGNTSPNRIFASDQGDDTKWTSSTTNQVFDYTINGASRLLTHIPVAGVNLIFTEHQTYLFQYIGLPLIWNIKLLEPNIGIISPMARCSANGTAYWMDTNNFYMWAGGNVMTIPANTQEQSTILNYVYGNINRGQQWKCFSWFNEQFLEVWFHYPSASSNECDRLARYHIVDQTWVPDTFDRVCAEYPNLPLDYPRLISSGGVVYQHEQGNDADGSAMSWNLTSNLRGGSNIMQRELGLPPKEISVLSGFIPDSIQTGNINVEIQAKRFPQSASNTYDINYTVTPTTEFISTEIGGRFWQYIWSGNSIGQQFIGGQWSEYVQPGSMQ